VSAVIEINVFDLLQRERTCTRVNARPRTSTCVHVRCVSVALLLYLVDGLQSRKNVVSEKNVSVDKSVECAVGKRSCRVEVHVFEAW